MGTIRTIVDDGKPYASIEDIIKEFEKIKTNYEGEQILEDVTFLDLVLKTFQEMEEEYYSKNVIFKKKRGRPKK